MAAGRFQPVNTARRPAGTARDSSGTTVIFAESPENETRWK
jgi:hypothetical protein